MNKNECKGCINDLTNKVVTNKEIISTIIDNCSCCKRGVIEEWKDKVQDLYKKKED